MSDKHPDGPEPIERRDTTITVGPIEVRASLRAPAIIFQGSGEYLPPLPSIVLPALVIPGDNTKEGQLIQAVAIPWVEIIRLMQKDPEIIYKIHWRKWEEIIAGAYEQAGFDEVILTPRTNDKGRDVIATKLGVGCVRIFDQVKAHGPGHLVTANDVRAMLGVVTGAGNVSKGVITTTSTFAPGVETDEFIKPFIPYRLELTPKDKLIPWLASLANGAGRR